MLRIGTVIDVCNRIDMWAGPPGLNLRAAQRWLNIVAGYCVGSAGPSLRSVVAGPDQ
jgi:hypothetical protein